MSADQRNVSVHPSAVVEAGAMLGDGVSVGPLSYVQDGAEVGAGTVVGPNVTILRFSSLGENCRVHAGAVVGDLPQDVSFGGDESHVRIGDGCQLRECVTVHRGTEAGSSTVIGDDCMLMATSHVAHNCVVGSKVVLANGAALGGRVEVGQGAFFGGGAMVHQFCRIGRLAMISGASAIKRDVPPFMITRELTSRVMGLNVVGLRRAGVAAAERRQLKRALKLLYHSGLNVSQAVAHMREELEGDCARELCDFIESSQRGITGWVST